MRLYSDLPVRRTRQVAADVFVLVWIICWIWVGVRLHHAVTAVAAPGHKIADAGTGLERNLRSAGDKIDDVPLLGKGAGSAFDRAGDAAAALHDAGRAQVDAINSLALFLGITVAVIPIAIMVVVWLPRRIRFIRRATAAAALLAAGATPDLFALRALATRPLTELAAITPDPATAWRTGDPATIDALASLELAATGLRPPTPAPLPPPNT